MVTHYSTNYPIRCLSSPERTGWSVLSDLWPYVMELDGLAYLLVHELLIGLVSSGLAWWRRRYGLTSE